MRVEIEAHNHCTAKELPRQIYQQREGATPREVREEKELSDQICDKSKSYSRERGDTAPCKMTGVTLHGVLSPESGMRGDANLLIEVLDALQESLKRGVIRLFGDSAGAGCAQAPQRHHQRNPAKREKLRK